MPPSTDFMIGAVASDFDVQLLKQAKDTALFAAKRQDTWHFVYWNSGDGKNFIGQVHAPRYMAAFGMDSCLRGGPMDQPGAVRLHRVWHDLHFGQNADEGFGLIYRESWFPCSDEWREQFIEDAELLRRARQAVINEDGVYTLRDASTFHGHPVSSTSWQLIEAMAFERQIRGVLDARDFALYSAFCTLRDFAPATAKPETAREFVEAQNQSIDIDLVPEDIGEVTRRMQSDVFSAPIWGPGIQVPVDHAEDILHAALKSLTDSQQAQITLLSGMYNTWAMVVMATVLGYMSFDRYAEIMAQGLPPDSVDEQELRTHLSFIELLGTLSAN